MSAQTVPETDEPEDPKNKGKKKPPKEKESISSFISTLFAASAAKDPTGEFITFRHQAEAGEGTYLVSKRYYRSGLELFDRLVRNGPFVGLGSGRMTELYGRNKTGKSALAMQIAHQTLIDHPDVDVIYVDFERALTERRIAGFPLFTSSGRFSIMVPSTLDAAFSKLRTILDRCLELKASVFIIFDSVASMRTASEMTAADGKVVPMAQAKMFAEWLPKLRGLLSKTHSHLLMLNQTRDGKATTMGGPAPDVTTGGQSISFYADYRFQTKSIGRWWFATGKVGKEGAAPTGFMSQIHAVKNKVGVPERSVVVPLTFFSSQGQPSGLSNAWSVWQALRDAGQLNTHKSGGWYRLKGEPEPFQRIDWIPYCAAHMSPDGYTGAIRDALDVWEKGLLNAEYGVGDEEEEEVTEPVLVDILDA